MQIDFTVEPRSAYSWMASAIIPRPVAWVSTCSIDGIVNLAPFSFFQMVTGSPPTLMISPLLHADGNFKDTTRNIIDTGEFVVNLVPFALAEKMNETSFSYAPETSEVEQCHIATRESVRVRPPLVANVPVSFECRLASIQAYPESRPSCHIILGEVMIAHIDERILDEKGQIDPARIDLISRMGADWYGRTHSNDNFSMQRPQGWNNPSFKPESRRLASEMLEEAYQHQVAGRLQQAELLTRHVLQQHPDQPDAMNFLAVLARQTGRYDFALDLIGRALKINPRNPQYYRNLGTLLKLMGRPEAAIAAFQKAVTIAPHFFEVFFDLGVSFREQGRLAEAESNFRKVLVIRAEYIEAYVNLGLVQKEQAKPAQAEASFRRALELNPEYAIGHNNLGVILLDREDFSEAEASFRRAMQIDPEYVDAYYNLSYICRETGRLQEAGAFCRRTLTLAPNKAEAHFHYGFLLLLTGALKQGWQEYEYRWNLFGADPRPNFVEPWWRGDADLFGKTILVYGEQGLGDTLQFARYAKLLAARGATVYLGVPPPLKSLMERCTGVAAVFAGMEQPLPFDYHCPVMSLPMAFGTELATIPGEVPYLVSDPAKVAQWGAVLGPKAAMRVGLVWAGNSRKNQPGAHAVDRLRSIHFNQLLPLLGIPGVEFFSLQLGDEARSQLNDNPAVRDLTDQLHDFHDTAALIENLDLVISVDTSVVHLAGALGKPVWVLNRFNTCWRWLTDRSDSPWYPSARIFRQPSFGDWNSVIAAVRKALTDLVRADVAAPPASDRMPQQSEGSQAGILQAAVAHHQGGRLQRADSLYRQILAADPQNAEALHLRGMLVHQTGDNESAAELIGKAIDTDPRNPLFYYNLGTVFRHLGMLDKSITSYRKALEFKEEFPDVHYKLGISYQQAGQWANAEASYLRALALRPDMAGVHNNLGSVLQQTGRLTEAATSFRQALRIDPDFTDALVNLGNLLKGAGIYQEAEACYRRALLINPDNALAFSNLGVMLAVLGRFPEAESNHRRALELKPDYAEIHNNLSFALSEQNRFREAEASARRALQLRPDFAEAYNNLGIALKGQGRFAEAEANYLRAVELKLESAEVHCNLGNLYRDGKRWQQADASFRRAIALVPHNAEAHFHLGFLLLLTGEFKQGWQEYEYRWNLHKAEPKPDFTEPLWNGDADLGGKSILLHAEQGFGDTLQFVRYAPRVVARGATVYLAVPAPLKSLAASCAGIHAVFGPGDALPSFDYQCPLLSLPLAFRTELNTIPADIPYLASRPARKTRWQEKLGKQSALRVGLAWAGNPRKDQPQAHALDRLRSIDFDQLRPLLDVPGVEFFSLQLGNDAAGQLIGNAQVRDFTAELHDFEDTAALMDNLDLVLTVDTAVAHLAGAIGKPVWLLNRYSSCWRWLAGRDDSPWYPTMRIFQQAAFGDWNDVIKRVKRALEERILETQPH